MELNREQIIQALEYCAGIKKLDACANCPAYLGCNDCVDFLREESLELINELIDENKILKGLTASDVITQETIKHIRDNLEKYGHNDPIGELGECGLKYKCKSDVIIKMQDKLKAELDEHYSLYFRVLGYDLIDKVAKEILEENK